MLVLGLSGVKVGIEDTENLPDTTTVTVMAMQSQWLAMVVPVPGYIDD